MAAGRTHCFSKALQQHLPEFFWVGVKGHMAVTGLGRKGPCVAQGLPVGVAAAAVHIHPHEADVGNDGGIQQIGHHQHVVHGCKVLCAAQLPVHIMQFHPVLQKRRGKVRLRGVQPAQGLRVV